MAAAAALRTLPTHAPLLLVMERKDEGEGADPSVLAALHVLWWWRRLELVTCEERRQLKVRTRLGTLAQPLRLTRVGTGAPGAVHSQRKCQCGCISAAPPVLTRPWQPLPWASRSQDPHAHSFTAVAALRHLLSMVRSGRNLDAHTSAPPLHPRSATRAQEERKSVLFELFNVRGATMRQAARARALRPVCPCSNYCTEMLR